MTVSSVFFSSEVGVSNSSSTCFRISFCSEIDLRTTFLYSSDDLRAQLRLVARDLVVGLVDALHGLAQLLDQAALDRLRELDGGDGLATRGCAGGRASSARLHVLGIALADLAVLLAQLQVLGVGGRDLVRELEGLALLVLELLVGDFFLDEDDRVTDADLALGQALGQPRDLLRRHRACG